MDVEARLVRRMIKDLHAHGAHAVNNHGSAASVRGTPDITGCYRSIFFGIEAKKDHHEFPTPSQVEQLSRINGSWGFTAVWWRFEQLAALYEMIDRYWMLMRVERPYFPGRNWLDYRAAEIAAEQVA